MKSIFIIGIPIGAIAVFGILFSTGTLQFNPPGSLPLENTDKTNELDPAARISELEKQFKDCSEFNFEELPFMEVLKLPDKEQYEYHKTKSEMLSNKIQCNQVNREISAQINHQRDLIEQKWVNSP